MSSEKQNQQTDANPIEHEIGASSSTATRGTSSLRQLRDRVHILVKELDRLRNENKSLIHRISELESAQNFKSSGLSIKFTEDKDQLLARVNAFIKTIDDYLLLEENQIDHESRIN